MSYDGLVLDHDGVLVDIADAGALTAAVEEAFQAAGIADPRAADVDALTVDIEAETVERVAERYGVDPATLWTARKSAVHDCLEREVRGPEGPLRGRGRPPGPRLPARRGEQQPGSDRLVRPRRALRDT